MVVARYIGLAQQFLAEHPLEGYAAVSGEPPPLPRDHPQRLGVPAHAAATQRLLPLPPAPRRHRAPRARSGLGDAIATPAAVCRGAQAGAASARVGSGDAAGGRCRRDLHRRCAGRAPTARSTPPRRPDARRASSAACMRAVASVLASAQAPSPASVERFAHGMTVATNALLEGRTARTALIATEGFTDVVELGRQARPHLYRLCEGGPKPLVPPRAALRRAGADGPDGPLRALERRAAEALAERSPQASPRRWRWCCCTPTPNPSTSAARRSCCAERCPARPVALARAGGDVPRVRARGDHGDRRRALASCSASTWRSFARRPTRAGLPEPQIMQSSGGLTDAARAGAARRADGALRARPAASAGRCCSPALAGERDVLCFDMGGTSCDVCVIEDGQVAETAERVAGRPLALPALDIHTVGAGGGSIAWRDAGGALRVGPASAGAEPGPACYGRGGEQPTVTDANLVLGPPARRHAARGRRAARPRGGRAGCRAPRRRAGPRAAGLRGGDRARRRGRDARGAARDDRRARHRPARASR